MMPDKIYVREYPDGLNQFWDRKERDDMVAVIYHEYIRKDTLLEWAKVYKEGADALTRGRTDNPSWGESVAMKNLINEINSL